MDNCISKPEARLRNLLLRRFPSKAWACLVFFMVGVGSFAQQTILNTPAPSWSLENWIHSKPLQLEDLKGKVVLVRWWTAPQCRYCRATAPALNEFHEKYQARGLQVIGVYHHKSDSPLTVSHVESAAREFGFKFPIAIDPDWKTLKRWWLDRSDESWTSVTFLIDREGVIRFIHPGGQYVKGDGDYEKLEAALQKLL